MSSLDLKIGLYYFQLDCSDTDSEDLAASCVWRSFTAISLKKNPNQIIKNQTKSQNKQNHQNLNKQPKPRNKLKHPLSILILKLLNLETDASNEFSSFLPAPSQVLRHFIIKSHCLGIFGIESIKKGLLQPLTRRNSFYPKLLNNLILFMFSLKALRLKDIYYKQML